jgi:hypothetical protein
VAAGAALRWQVSVSDSGEGIPKSGLREIFKPFTQVDEVSTRKYGGTGLGLSIVRNLVMAHGGKIGVASELGEGSTFTFTLEVRGVQCYVGYPFAPAAYQVAVRSCATTVHACVSALLHACVSALLHACVSALLHATRRESASVARVYTHKMGRRLRLAPSHRPPPTCIRGP